MTSLSTFITAYDDAALIAAASKGVVLRASKDAAGGKIRITASDGASARLVVDGETVDLSAKGVSASRCTCPATGLCRHIVGAMIFLRGASEVQLAPAEAKPAIVDTEPTRETVDRPEEAPASSPEPAAQMATFTKEEIERYAAADWSRALALAETRPEISGVGSRVVRFPDKGESVTFPPGRPLADALYKGPRTSRRRVVTAAAALALAREAGQSLPESEAGAAKQSVAADSRLLDLVQGALAEAVVALATGLTAPARDRLFSVAITARAEAIPRLAAELRVLSPRLDPIALRRAEETPVQVLADMARTYALAEALRRSPGDPTLTGVLSRSFGPAGSRNMILLGGEHWRSPSGARGFSMVLLDPERGSFHRATEARGAGADLTFRPEALWHQPVWLAGSPDGLIGRRLHFADAVMADDGALSLNQRSTSGELASLQDLEAAGVVVRDWGLLTGVMKAALGEGLRRRPGDAFSLVAPTKVESLGFDGLSQSLLWTWRDASGAGLTIKLSESMEDLEATASRVEAGLVALSPSGEARLLSLWLRGEARPYALQARRPTKPKVWQRVVSRVASRVAPRPMTMVTDLDGLELFLDRALEAVLVRLRQRHGTWPLPLLHEAEALGLSRIRSAMRMTEAGLTSRQALQLAYLLALGLEFSIPSATR